MPLNIYQRNILKDIRAEEQIYGLQFISLGTGAGYFSSLDAYKKITWTESISYFSGAILWNPYSKKSSSEGGFYKTSELVIVTSRDNRTIANSKNVKVNYDGIKFQVGRILDCPDTEEIVIYASRLE